MHMIAELGEAAHWYYKDQIYKSEIVNSKMYKNAWRSGQQNLAKSPADLFGMAKKQLLASKVLVFLEDKSTVIDLKKGNTALDVAFKIHSHVGLTLTKVSVNGKEVPLDYPLQNGDIVSCESNPGVLSVKPIWLDMATSKCSQRELRKYFRENNRAMLVTIGLMHFIFTLILSEGPLNEKYPNGIPDVSKLVDFIKYRTPSSITNFAKFFERLGEASKEDRATLIGNLLNIPACSLTVSSLKLALLYCNMNRKHGWAEEREIQQKILLPMIRNVLPQCECGDIENLWVELVGARSLVVEHAKPSRLPLEDLFMTSLGPHKKKYNMYPCVTKAPLHEQIPPSQYPVKYATFTKKSVVYLGK